jgi:hypothetical protein
VAFGDTWITEGVPLQVFNEASQRASRNAWENGGQLQDWWSFLSLADYLKVLRKSQRVWDVVYAPSLTPPDIPKRAGLKARTTWLADVVNLEASIQQDRAVSDDEYINLQGIADWLLGNESSEALKV